MEGGGKKEGQKCFAVKLRSLDYSAANHYGLHSAVINLQTMAETFVVVLHQRIRKLERIWGIIHPVLEFPQ